RRIEQMGEEPARVFMTGSPVVDSVLTEEPLSRAELEAALDAPVGNALLVTYHPVTLEHERTEERISILLEALESFENELIFTYPNADPSNAIIIEKLREFASRHARAHLFFNVGRKKYYSLQRYVAAMVGNSSSGMIEAASFRLPVVNIGDRQMGRMRTPNIIDVPESLRAIENGIQRALSPAFRNSIAEMESPYGTGDSSRKILDILKTVRL